MVAVKTAFNAFGIPAGRAGRARQRSFQADAVGGAGTPTQPLPLPAGIRKAINALIPAGGRGHAIRVNPRESVSKRQ
jgi:hypothetical protein